MSILAMTAFTFAEGNSGASAGFEASSEATLVAAAKSGETAAFGELCERYAKKILRVTHRITRNREDAEDAVQDSLLLAFTHLKDFDGRSRFSTWLTRIAINSALAKLRKNRGVREVPMDDPGPTDDPGPIHEFPDTAPSPEETYHQREHRAALHAAISRLRPRTRRVVEFHQLQEHTMKETARLLGISTVAAKSRMFHARAALRRTLSLKGLGRSRRVSAD
jgi:RNA polymerase sigma factor (sigma-70 family)